MNISSSKLLPVGIFLAVVSGSASALNFTVSGVEYSLSTVNGITSNLSQLSAQPWWNNQSLAYSFAEAAGSAGANYINFAYHYALSSSWMGGAYVEYASASSWGAYGGGLNILGANSSDWAIATRLSSYGSISSGVNLLANVGSIVAPVFDGGSLTLLSGDQTASNFTLNGQGGTLIAPPSGIAQLSGVFSGSGALNISGNDTVILSGENTYTGGTAISSGILQIGSDANLGAAAGTLTLNGGTLNTTSSLSMQRDIEIASASTIQTDADTTLISTGALSGSGDLTKSGAGRWTINGIGTNTGNVFVTGGTLTVGASDDYTSAHLNGSISVSSGSRLTGHGSVGSTGSTLTNAGTVAPGGSIGTLTVTGNFVQSPTATLEISINPAASSVLAVSGTASLAGTLNIDAESGLYRSGRYTVLTSSGLSGQFSQLTSNLGSYSSASTYLSYDASNVYFNIAPSASDTIASLMPNVQALQGIYAMQSALLNKALEYDCTVFDRRGVCLAAGNSYVQTGPERPESSHGLLLGAIRISDSLRIGAYLNQALSPTRQAGVGLGSRHPAFGGFAIWSAKNDGTGSEIHVAISSGSNPMNIVRTAAGVTGESGTGNTELHGKAASASISYGIPLAQRWLLSPYVGLRRTALRTDAYVEQATNDALSVGEVSQTSTAAMSGVRMAGKLTPAVRWTGSIGIEQDLRNRSSHYVAASDNIQGLTPIVFGNKLSHTRATASTGLNIAVARNQRVNVNISYRREPFQSANALAAMVSYQAGF